MQRTLYFSAMKKCLFLCLAWLAAVSAAGYNDHRGHDLDSLERAVARWTPDAAELISLAKEYGLV